VHHVQALSEADQQLELHSQHVCLLAEDVLRCCRALLLCALEALCIDLFVQRVQLLVGLLKPAEQ